MKKKILEWMSKDAEWYEFWLPDSGIVGGFIFGVIIGMVMLLVF